jgi:hypothetical protein
MARPYDDSAWFRKKSQILDEFVVSTRGLLDQVATQSHEHPPGHIQRQLSDLERRVKYQLSDANLALIERSVDMDLKSRRLSNDAALRRARITMEINKATLYADLQKEQADLKEINMFDELELDEALYNQAVREAFITSEKARIQGEVEDLKQQMAALPATAYDEEQALLDAKLLTAQKKLEALPFVEAILTNTNDIILTEALARAEIDQQKADSDDIKDYQDLIVTAQGLVNDQQVLLNAQSLAVADAKKSYIERANDLYGYAENKKARVDLYVEAVQDLLVPLEDKRLAIEAYTAKLDELDEPLQHKITAVQNYSAAVSNLGSEYSRKITAIESYTSTLDGIIAPTEEKNAAIEAYALKQDEYIASLGPLAGAYNALQDAELAAAAEASTAAEKRIDAANYEATEIAPAQTSKAQAMETRALSENDITAGYQAVALAEEYVAGLKQQIVDAVNTKKNYVSTTYMDAIDELNNAILQQVEDYKTLWTTRTDKAEAQVEANEAKKNLSGYEADVSVKREEISAQRSELSFLQMDTRKKEAIAREEAYDRLNSKADWANSKKISDYRRLQSATKDRAKAVLIDRLKKRMSDEITEINRQGADFWNQNAQARVEEYWKAKYMSQANITAKIMHSVAADV